MAAHCGDDRELREAVLRLLRADSREHTLLDGVASDAVEFTEFALLADQRVGPYRIVREIGIGGMGAVYLADREDGEFEQTVALKVMRPDTEAALLAHRFRAERQLLARLDHPGIARLLDGGVADDGRPYFTMEYVDGIPIDQYCHDNQLSVAQRVELFTQVLSAVAYAQQSLVVHRDLKPSNILVTRDGVVKLLDFGIAKILDAGRGPTLAADYTLIAAMTPQYAAPEQVRREPVTTATDVYSLGVVLYELLSGARPYDLSTATPVEVEELVCRAAAPLPSAAIPPGDASVVERFGVIAHRLRRQLVGDLDTICAMAMRKESSRRYASAQQMLDDVERHRAGRPVRARPDTLGYRLHKFTRRHARPLIIALVLTLAVAGLLAFFTARLAEERDRARREARKAESMSEFLRTLFRDAEPERALGREITVREILDKGAERIERELQGEPEVRASITDVIGTVYEKLGLYPEAKALLTTALTIRRQLYDSHPDLATSLYHMGSVEAELGQFETAEALIREGLAMREAEHGRHSAEVAESLKRLADVLYYRGDVNGAEVLLRQAIDIAGRVERGDPAQPMTTLALVLHLRHDYDGAERLYRSVLEVQQKRYGDQHPAVAWTMHSLGQVLMDQNRLDEAEDLQRRALARGREVHGDRDHPFQAMALAGLGRVLESKQELVRANALFEQAVAITARMQGDRHPYITGYMVDVARVLFLQADYRAAEATYRRARDIYIEHFGENYHRASFGLFEIGRVRFELGDYETAVDYQRRALAALTDYWGQHHWWITRVQEALAEALAATGKLDEALAVQQRAVENARSEWGEDHRHHLARLGALADIWRQRGDHRRAEQLARRSVTGHTERLGADHPGSTRAMERLARVLHARENYREAARLWRDVIAIRRRPALTGHPSLGFSLIGLARAQLALGETDAAAPMLREGLEILVGKLSATHPRVVAAREFAARSGLFDTDASR